MVFRLFRHLSQRAVFRIRRPMFKNSWQIITRQVVHDVRMSKQFKLLLACSFFYTSLEKYHGNICSERSHFSLIFLWSFNPSSTFKLEFLVWARVYLTSEFSLFDGCAAGFSTLGACQWTTPESAWKGCLKHGSHNLSNGSQLVWMQSGEQLYLQIYQIYWSLMHFSLLFVSQ